MAKRERALTAALSKSNLLLIEQRQNTEEAIGFASAQREHDPERIHAYQEKHARFHKQIVENNILLNNDDTN